MHGGVVRIYHILVHFASRIPTSFCHAIGRLNFQLAGGTYFTSRRPIAAFVIPAAVIVLSRFRRAASRERTMPAAVLRVNLGQLRM